MDDGRKLPAGLGEVILGPPRLGERLALDDPDMGQSIEALAEQITGYARHASVDVGESPGAGKQLPQNQGSSALGEDFRSQRYGAKLAVPSHAIEIDLFLARRQVQFLNFTVSRPAGAESNAQAPGARRCCQAARQPSWSFDSASRRKPGRSGYR